MKKWCQVIRSVAPVTQNHLSKPEDLILQNATRLGKSAPWWSEHVVFYFFWFGNVLRTTTACTFWTSQLPKVVWDRQFLTLLTSKCASPHKGVHFFDISTSKSCPTLVRFVHFDFEMCFATTACTFSTSQLQKVLRTWGGFSFFTCKCASGHNMPQRCAIFHFSSGQMAPHPPL